MKTEEITTRTSTTNTSQNGSATAPQLTYMPIEAVRPWPPQVPDGAEFLPIERFSSMFQVMEVRRTFDVSIKQSAYNKMMFYVMNAPGEVGGYGKVSRRGNSFLIEDVIVLEQSNGHSHNHISQDAIFRFMNQMRKRGLSTEGYNLSWHSHNDFGAFFSGEDKEHIESLANSRFTLSIVTNKMFDHVCRVDFYRPVRYGIENLPLKVIPEISRVRAAQFKEEMDQLIKKSPRRTR